ncbi:MAG: hypothetical protein M3457_07280, partial [Chloroflexota bacterium]|nr:hypothetical protein [Chloroflexota bacterium]
MLDRTRNWARARMAPGTWDQFRDVADRTGTSLRQQALAARRWATIGSEHVTSMRSPRIEPWRLLFAVFAVFGSAFFLAAVDQDRHDTPPALLLLVAIGLSTYIADWIGGIAAGISAIIWLDLLFVGTLMRFDSLSSVPHAATIGGFSIAAGLSIAIIEHLKYDRAKARLEAAALRAANSALSAVEI